MKQLLIEYIPLRYEKKSLLESIDNNDGRLLVPALLQSADKPNRNKRVYPRSILERECSRYNESSIRMRKALGELDHPDSNVVNLKNVSHLVTEIWWEGNDVHGNIEILNTPSGNIAKELLMAGVTLGISSRGVGSVESLREGEDPELVEVQPDFELLCWDLVSDPSTINAYLMPNASPHQSKGIRRGIGIGESYKPSLQEAKYHEANILMRDIICNLSCTCGIK